MGAGTLTADGRAEAVRLARKAVSLGKDDAFSLCWAAMSLAMFAGELEEAAALIDRALALDPKSGPSVEPERLGQNSARAARGRD